MAAVNYAEEAPKAATEFVSLYNSLQCARTRYNDLLNRAIDIGHKIKNTNYPQPEKVSKDPQIAKPDGFITEMEREADYIHSQNIRLEELVLKLEAII